MGTSNSELRGMREGSSVYYLAPDGRLVNEGWVVDKGEVTKNVSETNFARILPITGYGAHGWHYSINAAYNPSRMHTNLLFTPQEVIDALNVKEHRAAPDMEIGYSVEMDEGIDSVLATIPGNYFVAGALMKTLNQSRLFVPSIETLL